MRRYAVKTFRTFVCPPAVKAGSHVDIFQLAMQEISIGLYVIVSG